MRKIYASLLVLAMMVVSMTAKAQYSATFNVEPLADYVAGQKAVASATEVATALGLADNDALKALLATEPATGAVYLKTADGKSNTYTGNENEFWMNAAGVAQGHGDEGTCWFAGVEYLPAEADGAADSVNVWIGQMPNFFKKVYTDSSLKATLIIVSGDKEVTIDITQNISAATAPTLPLPDSILSRVNVVKDYELALEYTEGKDNAGTFSAKLDGIYELLGVAAADLDANVSDYVRAQKVSYVNVGGEASYTLADTLVEAYPGTTDGWFGRYTTFNDKDEEIPVAINAPHLWGKDATFFLHDLKLADGEFSVLSGQYVGTMAVGTADSTYLYIMNGSTAVRIKVKATVLPQETIDPNELVKAGESDASFTMVVQPNYTTKNFTIDMTPVLESLGCEASDIDTHYVWKAEGEMIPYGDTNDGYTAQDGYTGTWAAGSPYYIQAVDYETGTFKVGLYNASGIFTDIPDEGVVLKTWLIFLKETKYHVVNFTFTVTNPEEKPDDFEYKRVDGSVFEYQYVVDSGDQSSAFDIIDEIKTKIGTADYEMYTDLYDDSIKALVWDKRITCTGGGGGFWYGSATYDDGSKQVVDNAGWNGSTNSFGFGIEGKTINWFQNGGGARQAGDEFYSNLYFANETTGDYYQLVLHVLYVTEPGKEIEAALKYEELVALPADGSIDLNTDTICKALGVDIAQLVETIDWKFNKSLTTYIAGGDNKSFYLTADGYASEQGAGEQPAGTVSLITYFTEDEVSIVIDRSAEFPFANGDESEVKVQMVFDDATQNKRVVYILTIVSEGSEKITGIAGVQAAAQQGVRYNLAGQRVGADFKGIVIENGRKLLVK